MAGRVVHAREGRRDQYRPLESSLCASSRPEAVLEALLALFPFRCCYIADLDGILGRGDHREVVAALERDHPDLVFWLDAGGRAVPGVRARTVVGSESLPGDVVPVLPGDGVLSLDFRGETFLGPRGLLEDGQAWPGEVIVMTLERVGSGQGPDLERLASLRARAPDKRYYAAGGVRDGADLGALARAGATGVLLASALHDGRLGREELAPWHAAVPEGTAPAP